MKGESIRVSQEQKATHLGTEQDSNADANGAGPEPTNDGGTRETVWSTPQPIFDALDAEFNFYADLCADHENAKCEHYLMRDVSLDTDWWEFAGYWNFLNPPYGREIADWVKKCVQSKIDIVAFLPARTNAPWWHDYVMKAKEIRFVRRKVSFANPDGKNGVPPWGCAVVVFCGSDDFPAPSPLCTSWDYRSSQEQAR